MSSPPAESEPAKQFLSAEQLLQDSLALGLKIAASGFRPDLVIGVWRGGSPVAIAVQEVLESVGILCEHMPIRTSSYSNIARRADVKIFGLDHLRSFVHGKTRLLFVDDIFDTGSSIEALLHALQLSGSLSAAVRVAVPYYKPANNLTSREPDYYLHTTADWLVFPHELVGLSDEEILQQKPGLAALAPALLQLRTAMQKGEISTE